MAGTGTPLAEDTFWIRDESVLRLRVCHVTAWASGLAALVLAVPVRYPGADGVRATVTTREGSEAFRVPLLLPQTK